MNFLWRDLFCEIPERVCGIVLDSNHVLYAITNTKFFSFDSMKKFSGTLQLIAEIPQANFKGICFNGKDIIYITDAKNHKIYQYGVVTNIFEEFTELPGIDTFRRYISGRRFFGTTTHYCTPWGIATDKDGNLYTTECHVVRKIHITTKKAETINQNNTGHVDGPKAQFNTPAGLVVTDDGTIFLCDSENNCIRKMVFGEDSKPSTSTVAGYPTRDGPKDGNLKDATFGHPCGIVLNTDGTFFVTDCNSIRNVDLARGVVSTVKQDKCEITSITKDEEGNLFTSLFDKSTNQSRVVQMVKSWSIEKLLWIGKMKEQVTDCKLAMLPGEIIKVITGHVLN